LSFVGLFNERRLAQEKAESKPKNARGGGYMALLSVQMPKPFTLLSPVLLGGALCVAQLSFAGRAEAQIGRGGDQPAPKAAATAYRTEVRNRLNQLVIQLAEKWDGSDPGEVASLYTQRGVIVIGPERAIEGRDAIKSAFAATLCHMRGVVLTIDDYDLSGELAVVRGTMVYELLHDHASGTQETASYSMVLRRQRNDDWLIQQHVLAGAPALPDTAKANVSSTPQEPVIKQ
jgi:ketosteroid isomerase-like protein